MPTNQRSELDGPAQILTPIEGSPPDLFHPPTGCGYFARCPQAMQVCEHRRPENFELGDGHRSRCWLHHEASPRSIESLLVAGQQTAAP